ncbi:pyridoxamine 5'-phosphate oxidase family protein [Ulvibacterium sp.]|uniref:pyridoxamine 5'-phosphate oxidase family protein n=1 Tax=Ulvibacterium sp. TaxID=2665914 RepID=UPI003CC54CF0
MGKRMSRLTPRLISFIKNQRLFFVATAMKDGHINLSPKGLDSFKVIDENRIIWLNLTGSGNETATHLLHNERMTLMFCAFEGPPMILRLYGSAKVYHQYDDLWEENIGFFPEIAGARQLFDMQVELVQVSCGFGVPLMDYKQQRKELVEWAEEQGEEGLEEYREKKNTTSLDGHITDILSKTKP